MSVHYDKERKTYYVRYRVTNISTGKVTNRCKRGFTSKRDAILFDKVKESLTDTFPFSSAMEEYLASLEGYVSPDTTHARRRQMEMYCQRFMDTDVREIDKQSVLNWKNDLARMDKSIDTKNQVITVFKAIGKYCYTFHDFNDFAKVLKRFPKHSTSSKEMNIVSPEDFDLIVSKIDNDTMKDFFTFLYHTGVRRGEAIGLKKSAIDGRSVKIRESIRRRGKTSLKTLSSKRTIILDDAAYQSVYNHMGEEGEYVFGEYEPIAPQTVSNYWNSALRKANKEKDIGHVRVHDLRHSFVSNAIMNGANIVTVSKYVGHSDPTITLNTYSHMLVNSQKDMIGVLEGVYKK